MTRSALRASDWNSNVIALLAIGSTLWLSDRISELECFRSNLLAPTDDHEAPQCEQAKSGCGWLRHQRCNYDPERHFVARGRWLK